MEIRKRQSKEQQSKKHWPFSKSSQEIEQRPITLRRMRQHNSGATKRRYRWNCTKYSHQVQNFIYHIILLWNKKQIPQRFASTTMDQLEKYGSVCIFFEWVLGERTTTSQPNLGYSLMNKAWLTRLMQWKNSRFQSNKIKAEKGKLERAIQHLSPLGLSCVINRQPDDQLNISAREFQLKRNAAPLLICDCGIKLQ